ncbi:hypothetical protein H9P43_004146 [Blastocladiella emersonii ATCC 22665]|nr:hypothetical protein H9P43_004146 [Blastocladiella emersonii ATCC 22665]
MPSARRPTSALLAGLPSSPHSPGAPLASVAAVSMDGSTDMLNTSLDSAAAAALSHSLNISVGGGAHPGGGSPATPGPGAGPHKPTKFHPVTFHHSHFARNNDREPSTVTNIRQAILPVPLLPDQTVTAAHLEQERQKRAGTTGGGASTGYMAEKVQTRTTSRIVTRDSKAVAAERSKRRQMVMVTGFNSSTREAYKPLGAPVLNVEDLVATTLGVAVRKSHSNHQRKQASSNHHRASTSAGARDPTGAPGSASNRAGSQDGYDKLRERVDLSKSRLQSVKFGVSIAKTMEDPRKVAEREMEAQRKQREATTGTYRDWTVQKIDRDKMHYYLRLLQATIENQAAAGSGGAGGANGGGSGSGGADGADRGDHDDGSGHDTRGHHGGGSSVSSSQSPSRAASSNPRSSSRAGVASRGPQAGQEGSSTERDPRHMTPEELEAALNVQRSPMPNPEAVVQAMRSSFQKERQRLSNALDEELERVERQRPSVITHKFKAFEIGVNGICSSDMEHMRTNATIQRVQERTKTLRTHPWYNDLLRVVFGGNTGLRKHVSDSEHALLARIRALIGDGIPLDKLEFVRLMKLIPNADFMRDDVQKIFKFLRVHLGISELDYLDAIESSGQMMIASSSGAPGSAGSAAASSSLLSSSAGISSGAHNTGPGVALALTLGPPQTNNASSSRVGSASHHRQHHGGGGSGGGGGGALAATDAAAASRRTSSLALNSHA